MILQHWRPLSSKGVVDDDGDDNSDNDAEEEGDKAFMEFEKVSAFANPVQRRRKKDMDFRKWKEITQDNNSSLGKEAEEDVSSFRRNTRKKKNVNDGVNAGKKTSTSSNDNVLASTELGAKMQLDNSDGGFINAATSMELDVSNKVKPDLERIHSDRTPDYNVDSLDVLGPEKNYSSSSLLSCSSFRSEQEPMSFEREIDAENQARIKQMSAEEIVEARAEIMEKISPALLEVLQKRGKEKLKKHSSLKSEVGTGSESVNPRHVQNTQDAKCVHKEDDISHTNMTPPSRQKLDDEKISTETTSTTSNSLWNAWSNRVEAIRELRFSLAGDVVQSQTAPLSAYGMTCIFFFFSFILSFEV